MTTLKACLGIILNSQVKGINYFFSHYITSLPLTSGTISDIVYMWDNKHGYTDI